MAPVINLFTSSGNVCKSVIRPNMSIKIFWKTNNHIGFILFNKKTFHDVIQLHNYPCLQTSTDIFCRVISHKTGQLTFTCCNFDLSQVMLPQKALHDSVFNSREHQANILSVCRQAPRYKTATWEERANQQKVACKG